MRKSNVSLLLIHRYYFKIQQSILTRLLKSSQLAVKELALYTCIFSLPIFRALLMKIAIIEGTIAIGQINTKMKRVSGTRQFAG